jgi:hypothetical protein
VEQLSRFINADDEGFRWATEKDPTIEISDRDNDVHVFTCVTVQEEMTSIADTFWHEWVLLQVYRVCALCYELHQRQLALAQVEADFSELVFGATSSKGSDGPPVIECLSPRIPRSPKRGNSSETFAPSLKASLRSMRLQCVGG